MVLFSSTFANAEDHQSVNAAHETLKQAEALLSRGPIVVSEEEIDDASYAEPEVIPPEMSPAVSEQDPQVSEVSPQASEASPLVEAREVLQRASTAYRERQDYLGAIEWVHEVLGSEPENREARHLKEAIDHDLDKHITLFDKEQDYKIPEGNIAYKIAVSDGIITVDEAVDIALKSSVKLQSLKKKVHGAQGKVLEARRAFYPTLTGEIAVNGGIVAGNAYTGEEFMLNASQPLYYGGELFYTLRQAESILKSDQAKYEKERLDIAQKTREAYYGVVKADYNVSYQNHLLDEVGIIRDRIVKAYERKLVSEVEYLEVVSLHYRVHSSHESAVNDFQSADLLLHQLLGLSPEEIAPVSTELEYEEIPLDLEHIRLLAGQNNFDILIKEAASHSAYYGLKVFDAKKQIRVDVRGSAGLSGEINVDSGTSPDIEKEWSLFFDASLPLGGSTAKYNFRRRKFGTTVLDVTGSEDFRHSWSVGFLDNLADMTDEKLAYGTYLEAKDELEAEKMKVEINVRDHFYGYHQALIAIDTSLARMKYLETEVNVLKAMVEMEEARMPDLLDQMVALAEERFAHVKSITDLYVAVSQLNTDVGDANYFKVKGS